LRGDVLLGETLKFAENHDFAAASWQRVNRPREQLNFIAGADNIDDTGPIIYDVRERGFHYTLHRRGSIPAEPVDRDVGRYTEEESFGGLNPLGGF
jgi:hypothetical protein